jgi:hypothetical protein
LADITTSGALSRHITEYLTTDKSVKYYKCKTLQNPDFCFNGTLYTPVDATYKTDTVTKAGSVSLASKGIVSVGIKNADDQYKFIGLRPDEKQDGTEQFEICPELLEINGKSQTIDLSTRSAISSITTKYGSNLYVQRARQRLRIMMLADDTCESFKMTLRFYLTGLKVKYNEKLDEYWIYNTDGKFRFRLGKPYLVDPLTMNPLKNDFGMSYQETVKHSLIEVSKGEYLYIKEADKGFVDVKLPKSFLIDADTVYSASTDCYIWTGANYVTWASRRDATSGTVGAATSSYDEWTVCAYYDSGAVYYQVVRGFYNWALTGLSGTVVSVTENHYGYSANSIPVVCTQKSTHSDTPISGDIDAYTGDYYDKTSAWSLTGYNVLTYNAQGISDVEDTLDSTFKTCLRDYEFDYTKTGTPSQKNRSGTYFSENTSTTKDPYLYVTMEAGATVKPHYYYLQQ